MAKYASLALKEYGHASTIAEEIIASVRTVQAFGTQDKLAKLYDDNLVAAQKTGYKQQFAGAVMLSCLFFCIYSFYGLGFCTIPSRPMLTTRGRIEITRCRRIDRRCSNHGAVCRHHWCFLLGRPGTSN
jgi:hypothetical protein